MACKSLNKVRLGDDIEEEMLSITVGNGKECQTFSIHKHLLQKVTQYLNKLLTSKDGQKGVIVLKDEDAETFKMFYDWLYTGNIQKAPTKIPIKSMPSQLEIALLEASLRIRFDAQIGKIIGLYLLGLKYNIEHLQNSAIDCIQDGFHEFGTVFGPGQIIRIFKSTPKGNKLRELCIASNVIHIDRGCEQLRDELIKVSRETEDFFPEMMKWISRNFVMFGRRQSEGFDVRKPTQGFSMFNRKKLCPCHFHKHDKASDAHKGHKKCAVPFMKCGHLEEDGDAMDISS